MSLVDEVAAQLRDELGGAAQRLAVLVGGSEMIEWELAIDRRAPLLAHQLCQDDDDRLLAQTVIDVMNALWGTCDPGPEWWRTPVGRRCAHSFGQTPAGEEPESVTHSVAAAMLGITRGAVGSYVAKGLLDRHPDGGVSVISVYQRLGR